MRKGVVYYYFRKRRRSKNFALFVIPGDNFSARKFLKVFFHHFRRQVYGVNILHPASFQMGNKYTCAATHVQNTILGADAYPVQNGVYYRGDLRLLVTIPPLSVPIKESFCFIVHMSV